jgi:23S rRNA (cytosine1962-C5)-methyltransferase
MARICDGRRLLNGFGYTGAFSVYAKQGGAQRVVTVDSSAPAIETAKRNFAINGFTIIPEDFVMADLFHFLRSTTQKFDCIVLDPPAFAHRQKDIENASRAYKDINLQAMKIIEPEGFVELLVLAADLAGAFSKILFGAAADAAGRFAFSGKAAMRRIIRSASIIRKADICKRCCCTSAD